MSSLSGLSAAYWQASDFSLKFDRVLRVLKRAVLQRGTVSDADVANSASGLAELLVVLANVLESGPANAGAEAVRQLPPEFLARLSSESADLPDRPTAAALREISTKLSRGDPRTMSAADVAILDDIAALADSNASDVFRNLTRP
jgi:hypothetical protein